MGIIGYNTIAGSSANRENANAGFWDVTSDYTPAEDEILVQGFLYANNISGSPVQIEIGCYRVSDASLVEVATLTIPSGTGPAWYSVNFAGSATLLTGVAYRNALASPVSGAIDVYRDVVVDAEGFDVDITGSTGLLSPFTQDGLGNYRYSTYLTTQSASSSPIISTAPATAYPGEVISITGTNLSSVTADYDGVSATVNVINDTNIEVTINQSNLEYASHLLTLTNLSGSDSTSIELVANTANGFGYIVLANPNTSDPSSVAYNTSPLAVTGDQFEWEDYVPLGNLTINAQGFISNVDAEGFFRGRFWDASDSTWGPTEEFQVTAGGVIVRNSLFRPLFSNLILENLEDLFQ